MNTSLLLALAMLFMRDPKRDRRLLKDYLDTLLDPPLSKPQIAGVVDLVERGESSHELLPMLALLGAGQIPAALPAATTTTTAATPAATTTTVPGIDPSLLILLMMLTQRDNSW